MLAVSVNEIRQSEKEAKHGTLFSFGLSFVGWPTLMFPMTCRGFRFSLTAGIRGLVWTSFVSRTNKYRRKLPRALFVVLLRFYHQPTHLARN